MQASPWPIARFFVLRRWQHISIFYYKDDHAFALRCHEDLSDNCDFTRLILTSLLSGSCKIFSHLSIKVADNTVFQSSQLVIFKCKHSMEVRVQGPPRGCITNQCSRWNHIVRLAFRYWTTMSPRIIAVKGPQIHLITMNSFSPSTHLQLIMLAMIPLLVQASHLIEVLYLPNILSHTGQININLLKIHMGHQWAALPWLMMAMHWSTFWGI